MAMKHTKSLQNIPNGHKIYQHCLFQGPPKYTQIGILGLEVYHLATLINTPFFLLKKFFDNFYNSALDFPHHGTELFKTDATPLVPSVTKNQCCHIFLGPNIPKPEIYIK
jgi:hypothetical protein